MTHNPATGLDCVSAGAVRKRDVLHKSSPREIRAAKVKTPDFQCEACGEEWNTPGHIWWVCRMRCVCGEVVEAK